MELEEMKPEFLSSAELDKQIKLNRKVGKKNIAYLPVGCIEQHGPVLPLETDSLVAAAMAHSLCSTMNKMNYWGYVFPTLHYTPCQSSANFSGTVSVADEYFRPYVRQIAKSILRSQFDALILVSGHAGADSGLKDVGYWQVYEQFETKTETIRPVLVLSLFECSPDLDRHFKQKPGRHADWRELLLIYHIIGKDFFDSRRRAELQNLYEYNKSNITPSMIYGIPIEYRSNAGVIGEPLPAAGEDWDVLAERMWDCTLQHISVKLTEQLESFWRVWEKNSL